MHGLQAAQPQTPEFNRWEIKAKEGDCDSDEIRLNLILSEIPIKQSISQSVLFSLPMRDSARYVRR